MSYLLVVTSSQNEEMVRELDEIIDALQSGEVELNLDLVLFRRVLCPLDFLLWFGFNRLV
jgi:hypothetical protein